MESRYISLVIVLALLVANAWSGPALHEPEWHAPREGAAELGARLAAHAQRPPDARLPLPSPQELDAIKKVAQILIMLGEQVIPTIIGEPPSSCDPTQIDVPNDIVSDNS